MCMTIETLASLKFRSQIGAVGSETEVIDRNRAEFEVAEITTEAWPSFQFQGTV